MAELSPAQIALLEGKNFGALGTTRADGTPHVSPVWVHTDGEVVTFNTARGRAKDLHLRRDNRATVMVFDLAEPYRYLEVSGTVELSDEGGAAGIDFLSNKYLGTDYPDHSDEVRVNGRLTPEWIGGNL